MRKLLGGTSHCHHGLSSLPNAWAVVVDCIAHRRLLLSIHRALPARKPWLKELGDRAIFAPRVCCQNGLPNIGPLATPTNLSIAYTKLFVKYFEDFIYEK